MAKEYKLTQEEVANAYELGSTMVLALLLKLALDAQDDRDSAAKHIEEGTQQLIAQLNLKDVPTARHQEFRRAAEDRAMYIVRIANNMRRYEGPPGMQ